MYLECYYGNKADIGVKCLILIVDRYKTLGLLLSVLLKAADLFIGTSCEVSASA